MKHAFPPVDWLLIAIRKGFSSWCFSWEGTRSSYIWIIRSPVYYQFEGFVPETWVWHQWMVRVLLQKTPRYQPPKWSGTQDPKQEEHIVMENSAQGQHCQTHVNRTNNLLNNLSNDPTTNWANFGAGPGSWFAVSRNSHWGSKGKWELEAGSLLTGVSAWLAVAQPSDYHGRSSGVLFASWLLGSSHLKFTDEETAAVELFTLPVVTNLSMSPFQFG